MAEFRSENAHLALLMVGQDAKFLDFIYRLNPKFATDFVQKNECVDAVLSKA